MSEMLEAVKEEEKEYELQYYVVINHEEQYSIWPTYKPIPRGWKTVGEARNKADCLSYIDEVWTDMRPLSLRKKMEELGMEVSSQKKDKKVKVYDAKPIEVTDKKVKTKNSNNKGAETTPKKKSVFKKKVVKSGKKISKR